MGESWFNPQRCRFCVGTKILYISSIYMYEITILPANQSDQVDIKMLQQRGERSITTSTHSSAGLTGLVVYISR